MKTLLLDAVKWDLVKDVSGNIALASEPYSLAQDAASAIKLFARELWYDTSKGIPYFEQFLGKAPNLALMKAKFVDAAKTVPGVVSAKVFISSIKNRTVSGQVQVTDTNGITTAASFVAEPPGN
jgi:hypothetical protein